MCFTCGLMWKSYAFLLTHFLFTNNLLLWLSKLLSEFWKPLLEKYTSQYIETKSSGVLQLDSFPESFLQSFRQWYVVVIRIFLFKYMFCMYCVFLHLMDIRLITSSLVIFCVHDVRYSFFSAWESPSYNRRGKSSTLSCKFLSPR